MNINLFYLTPGNIFLLSFWLTWGPALVIMIPIVIAALIFHSVKIKKIKNEKEDLERQVIERNELLSYSKLSEQKARKEAELLYKNKSLLISKISHDIRTPMNAIMGMASLLNETNPTVEQREYTTTIQNSGERLLNVVNEILMDDILEYSKVESGNELEEKDFDLRNCVEEVLDVFAIKAAKANLELLYVIDDNVPPQIMGDAFRLRQILTNLVENAFRFTSAGEILIGIKTVERRDGNRVKLEFEVRDTGMGMTPERKARVSKDLMKSDSIDEGGDTIGLTLIICKRLINLMGGSIRVESRENEGTSFKFTIYTTISQKSLRGHNAELAGLEGKKILVVDDNATSGHVLKSMLKNWGLETTVVTSGKQALETLKQTNDFELVLTDQLTSELDAIKFAEYIKQLYHDLPVILLHKQGDDNRMQDSKIFNGVINKPVRNHILSKQVFSGLRQKNKLFLSEEQNYKQKLSSDFSSQFPLRILIAEDDKLNQKFALKILNKLGYEPQVANNGQEVLELVSQKKYDVILMDVQMPVMNGLEATKMIRVCLDNQPFIVAMTANTMQGDREECIMAGMDDYISKPINLKDLVIVLEKCALQVR